MNRIKKYAGPGLVLMIAMLAGSCWNSAVGTKMIPNTTYSGMMSNTDLRVLTVTAKEGATGTMSELTLSPDFDPKTYIYTVTFASIVTEATIEAIADDDMASVSINSVAGSSRTLPTGEPSMTVSIDVTAPDGVTIDTYQLNFIRTYDINENRLLALEVNSEDDEPLTLNPTFHPDTSAYQVRVNWGDDYITIRPRAINIYSVIKLNNKKMNSGEEELVILTIPKEDYTTTQAVTLTVTPSDGTTKTYTLTLIRGAKPSSEADDPRLEFIKVTMGNKESARPLDQDANGDFFPDNDLGFNKDVEDYSCAVFGFRTINVTAKGLDPKVKSITVDGLTGTFQDGKAIVPITLPDNAIKEIPIVVTSQDNTQTKTYTVRVRLLNIYEMFYGIYGSVSRINKASWGSPGTPNWTKVFNGSISGSMEWKLTWVQTLSTVENRMTYATYNNGDHDMPFVGDNGGFALNGIMSVIVNTSGTGQGPQTGDVSMLTPEGDLIAMLHVHYKVVSKDAVSNDADSYTDVDYMDQTAARLYYIANPPGKDNLGEGKWDPAVPWTRDSFWHP